jgi:hypothetical protein
MKAETDSLLKIETALVRPPEGCVRIIAGDVWWDVARDDVSRIEPLEREGLVKTRARYARVYLACGARLMAIGPADEYREQLWQTVQPFALATRPPFEFEHPASYRALEQAFVERNCRRTKR